MLDFISRSLGPAFSLEKVPLDCRAMFFSFFFDYSLLGLFLSHRNEFAGAFQVFLKLETLLS
jgi:hypothetical protein